jgi:ectoine hydroxylase-related dioxygenase (phytanoyl-CoA dioxygenase family)
MATAGTTTQVTDEQLDQFHREGYLVLEAAFDADEVARMRREARHILQLAVNSSLCQEHRELLPIN